MTRQMLKESTSHKSPFPSSHSLVFCLRAPPSLALFLLFGLSCSVAVVWWLTAFSAGTLYVSLLCCSDNESECVTVHVRVGKRERERERVARKRYRAHTRQEVLPLIPVATPDSIAPAATIDLMEAQADSSVAGKNKHLLGSTLRRI